MSKKYNPKNFSRIIKNLSIYEDGEPLSPMEAYEILKSIFDGEINKIIKQLCIENGETIKEKEDVIMPDIKPAKKKDDNPLSVVKGKITTETAKALNIDFFKNDGETTWIPKSTIKSQFKSDKEIEQDFSIETWVLEKNKVIV